MKKFFAVLFSGLLLMPVLAFAETSNGGLGHMLGHGSMGMQIKAGINASTTPTSLTTVTGTVASVSGESISLTASSTSYTIDATNSKIYRKFGATMAIADIQTGDSLNVRGTLSGTTIAATVIRDMSQQQRNATFNGTVTALNGTSFTLQSRERGVQTVNTSSTTTYKKNGKTDSNGLADVLVGSTLTVSGVWDSTGNNVAADSINIIVRNVTVTGVVQSISGEILSVTGSHSSSTVYSIDATNAKLMRRFGAAMAITDFQTGDTVTATGPLLGNNMAAVTIRDVSLQAHNGTFTGTVSAVNGSSFTLQSKGRGSQNINTTGTTIFRLGSASTSIASLAVGETATVSGVWDRTNSNVTANRVAIKVSGLTITGTLQSINGTQLTVMSSPSTSSGSTTAATLYTVNASSAKVRFAHNHTGSLSTFQVNDQVKVWGKATSGSVDVMASIVQDLSRTYTGTSTPQ